MLNKSSATTRRPLWIITSYENNRMDALTLGPDLDGGFLAVFSFEEEAEAFLWLSGDDEKKGWQSEQMTSGELVSILSGPCADVKRVVLDPLPLPLGRAMLPVVGVKRDAFLRCLSEDARTLVYHGFFRRVFDTRKGRLVQHEPGSRVHHTRGWRA